jgi:metal-responsive CopG/Arc/MetJ family transcriptional regulator
MEQISYNCPTDLLIKINDESSSGTFSSRSEFITLAIRFYFENRDRVFNPKDEIRQFLESDEGQKLLLDTVRNLKN